MKIAVASQNRKTVTGHAGKCRRFWIYDVDGERVAGRDMLELALEETFHESHGHGAHPLDGISALISASMGTNMYARLAAKGITGVATSETDPDTAVAAYLQGTLVILPPEAHHEEHEHGHGHGHGHHHPH